MNALINGMASHYMLGHFLETAMVQGLSTSDVHEYRQLPEVVS